MNRIKNRVLFKRKTRHRLELLPDKTKRLLGSTEQDIDQDKNGNTMSKLELVEVVSMHCNAVNYSYQQHQKCYSHVPDK